MFILGKIKYVIFDYFVVTFLGLGSLSFFLRFDVHLKFKGYRNYYKLFTILHVINKRDQRRRMYRRRVLVKYFLWLPNFTFFISISVFSQFLNRQNEKNWLLPLADNAAFVSGAASQAVMAKTSYWVQCPAARSTFIY